MKATGPEAALALIEPLAEPLAGYFYFHGLKGALLKQLNRPREARAASQSQHGAHRRSGPKPLTPARCPPS